MKKVLFLQLKGNSYAGVWQVNKTIAETLIDKGYDVHILALRNNKNDIPLEHDKRLVLDVINKKDVWEDNYTGREIIAMIKKMRIFKAIKMSCIKIKHNITKYKDKLEVVKYIKDYNPNCIITTHYELIEMIPREYQNITYHEQHSSFESAISNIGNKRVFNKYKEKIKFIWLSKKTMDDAIKYGIKNSIYIYNPVRFKNNAKIDILNNQTLVTLGRFSKEKRIPLMIEIVKEIFKDPIFKDWHFEIYGEGTEEETIKKLIANHKQIKFMGLTNNPQMVFNHASINLNTSTTEGFSMTILEANECGVPTITFNFGEAVNEEIIDGETGIIAKNEEDYVNKLKILMQDKNKLKALSQNVKEFNQNFRIEKIIDKWIKLIEEVGE